MQVPHSWSWLLFAWACTCRHTHTSQKSLQHTRAHLLLFRIIYLVMCTKWYAWMFWMVTMTNIHDIHCDNEYINAYMVTWFVHLLMYRYAAMLTWAVTASQSQRSCGDMEAPAILRLIFLLYGRLSKPSLRVHLWSTCIVLWCGMRVLSRTALSFCCTVYYVSLYTSSTFTLLFIFYSCTLKDFFNEFLPSFQKRLHHVNDGNNERYFLMLWDRRM